MKNANQDLNRLQQPNVLPISVGWTCYLGNLGLHSLGYKQTSSRPKLRSALPPGADYWSRHMNRSE